MKKLLVLTFSICLLHVALFAQVPNAFKYQAIARNSAGEVLSNEDVKFVLSLLQGDINGSIIYAEEHQVTTNKFGVVSLNIGQGVVLSGNFETIDWSTGSYFIQVKLNDILLGTSQLLSVPYAKYAEKAGACEHQTLRVSEFEDTLYFSQKNYVIIPGISSANRMYNCQVDSIIDERDGEIYKIVTIGNQIWMAENMKAEVYSDGSNIENRFLYGHDIESLAVYGRLYTWDAAMNNSQVEKAQGICPNGWHIPSNDELLELLNYYGGPLVAGGKMKVAGTQYWKSPNTNATNASCFSMLPGSFYDINNHMMGESNVSGYFWTSTQINSQQAYSANFYFDKEEVNKGESYKTSAISIRCIKD